MAACVNVQVAWLLGMTKRRCVHRSCCLSRRGGKTLWTSVAKALSGQCRLGGPCGLKSLRGMTGPGWRRPGASGQVSVHEDKSRDWWLSSPRRGEVGQPGGVSLRGARVSQEAGE